MPSLELLEGVLELKEAVPNVGLLLLDNHGLLTSCIELPNVSRHHRTPTS